jgi:hypothetical protein
MELPPLRPREPEPRLRIDQEPEPARRLIVALDQLLSPAADRRIVTTSGGFMPAERGRRQLSAVTFYRRGIVTQIQPDNVTTATRRSICASRSVA